MFVLADTSGSMGPDGKIDALNLAIRDLIESLSDEQDARGVVHIGVITFGQELARLHTPLAPADTIPWTDVFAQGVPNGRGVHLVTRTA